MTVDELFGKLEDGNHHNLAAVLLAVAACDYDAVLQLGDIIKRHLAAGSLSHDDCSRRSVIFATCLASARSKGVL